jgi:hypothetical protein
LRGGFLSLPKPSTPDDVGCAAREKECEGVKSTSDIRGLGLIDIAKPFATECERAKCAEPPLII